jgi:hypothetical protein
MRYAVSLPLSLIVTLAIASGAQERKDIHPFDGTWDTILSCTNNSGAYGYSDRFRSEIKEGMLHGEHGTKGQPGWLEINGKIKLDGDMELYANGLVGAAAYAVGRIPAGTEYGYHIEGRFIDDEGKGKRVEGRPCEVTFARVRTKDKD